MCRKLHILRNLAANRKNRHLLGDWLTCSFSIVQNESFPDRAGLP
jgi:hypothetical protein